MAAVAVMFALGLGHSWMLRGPFFRRIGRGFCVRNVDATLFERLAQGRTSLSEVHRQATEWLAARNVLDAEDSSRHLLAEATRIGSRYSDFQRNLNRLVTREEAKVFEDFCTKRAGHVPVQYIIGNWDFYGMTFLCKPPILIPRPETEELVEKVLDAVHGLRSLPKISILDVGAGSGVIGITLAAHLPNAQVVALDVNPQAVALANENADRLLPAGDRARYSCVHTSFQDYAVHRRSLPEKFDLIVSNPPYIPAGDMPTLQEEVRRYEDHVALNGGPDGLEIIHQLIASAPDLLSEGGTKQLWMETDPSHPPLLEDCFRQGTSIDLRRARRVQGFADLSANQRFVCITFR